MEEEWSGGRVEWRKNGMGGGRVSRRELRNLSKRKRKTEHQKGKQIHDDETLIVCLTLEEMLMTQEWKKEGKRSCPQAVRGIDETTIEGRMLRGCLYR